jgi:hypothetical protein
MNMKNVYVALAATLMMAGMNGQVSAEGSTRHLSKAVDHSARAAFHASAGTGKLISGAVAVPLMVGGEIGKASGAVGDKLWDEANATLPITDAVITVGPSPAEAMADEEKH